MHKHLPYISAAVLVTLIFGTMYTLAQQVLRSSANDPQIQLAEDTAAQLNAGASAASLASGKIDVSQSLAPFLIIYDTSGNVVAGSGYLHGSIPVIPFGVLAHTTAANENRITWQPAAGVRDAVITVAANHYYVLSGRSLRVVEERENDTLWLSMLGWLAALVVLLLTVLLLHPHRPVHHGKKH